MNSRAYAVRDERSLAEIVAEIKDELKEFIQTRVALLQSEFKDNMSSLKRALPLAGMALVLLGTAYLLLTLALVALVAVAFWGNPYAWFFALLIVGGVWLLFGAMLAFFAYNQFRSHGLMPKKTVEVLKADKMWLENQARSQV